MDRNFIDSAFWIKYQNDYKGMYSPGICRDFSGYLRRSLNEEDFRFLVSFDTTDNQARSRRECSVCREKFKPMSWLRVTPELRAALQRERDLVRAVARLRREISFWGNFFIDRRGGTPTIGCACTTIDKDGQTCLQKALHDPKNLDIKGLSYPSQTFESANNILQAILGNRRRVA